MQVFAALIALMFSSFANAGVFAVFNPGGPNTMRLMTDTSKLCTRFKYDNKTDWLRGDMVSDRFGMVVAQGCWRKYHYASSNGRPAHDEIEFCEIFEGHSNCLGYFAGYFIAVDSLPRSAF